LSVGAKSRFSHSLFTITRPVDQALASRHILTLVLCHSAHVPAHCGSIRRRDGDDGFFAPERRGGGCRAVSIRYRSAVNLRSAVAPFDARHQCSFSTYSRRL